MKSKIILIIINSLPIIGMILLIPAIKNDYILTLVYSLLIAALLSIKREPKDLLVLAFGFCIMIVSEYFFVSTGVETFTRQTLFSLMPLWLPFLWAYGFVVIKRSVLILQR